MSRQERTAYWHAVFPSVIAKSALSSPVHSYAPYFAAFEFTNASEKVRNVTDLGRKGLFAMTWPDLPPEVLNSQDQHAHAIEMKKKIFFLPVHSSLKFSEIKSSVDRLSNKNINYEIRTADETEWASFTSKHYVNNLVQAWNYGTAKSKVSGWRVLRLIISDGTKRAVAIIQVYEKKIPVLGSLIRISRGPTMLCSYESSDYYCNYNLVVSELIKYSKKDNWRILQCSFDMPQSSAAKSHLCSLGFYSLKGAAWGSGLIDLELSEIALRDKLNRRWKRILKKTVKNEIIIRKVEVTDKVIDEITKCLSAGSE